METNGRSLQHDSECAEQNSSREAELVKVEPELDPQPSSPSRWKRLKKHSSSFSFSDSDFFVDINEISFGEQIGSGAFATVFHGVYKDQQVAIKKQLVRDRNPETYLVRELSILKTLKHENLVKYVGACKTEGVENAVWILTEFLPGGDLQTLLSEPEISLSWERKVQMALDVARGLSYLHSKGVIHRDIKCINILLDEDYTCHLADFGFARQTHLAGRKRMSICGTDDYMAPEICFDEEYDERADIFSFGIVLIEIITRRKVNQDGFLRRIPQRKFKIDEEELDQSFPTDCPPSLALLAKQCTSFDAEDRLATAQEVVDWLEDLARDLSKESSNNAAVPLRDSLRLSSTSSSTILLPSDQGNPEPDEAVPREEDALVQENTHG